MNRPVIAFFNNKGGVGKTSLTYHLSWMLADLGMPVLAVDLDPQANLTSAFLDEERLEELWNERGEAPLTVFGAIRPLLRRIGDVTEHPHVERLDDRLHLVPGDLALARFEDELSQQWPACLDRKEGAFRVLSAFWRLIQIAASQVSSEVALVDLGPNLGAVNRAGLIAADYLVVPLAPDLFSLQGLKNLGPSVREWREGWRERLEKKPSDLELELPSGSIEPVGYVVLQHAVRLDRPVKAYEKWVRRVPLVYSEHVLKQTPDPGLSFANDPECLGLLKHYRSLMPLAQEARKPIFHLKPADGALGAHAAAAEDARKDFLRLALRIAKRCDLALPSETVRFGAEVTPGGPAAGTQG
jgi:cellulose biosynthesis protein BcsQ